MPDSNSTLDSFWDRSIGQQLEAVHQVHQAKFKAILNEILNNYGLAEQLRAAKASGAKFNILDIGCGEGLYLHDIAQALEERQLLSAANCFGIDINPNLITVAEQFAKLANPPRPYLYFYTQDATKPFETGPLAQLWSIEQFDFIYIINTLEMLPQAEQQLERFYKILKPGGLILLRCPILHKGEEGWLPIHNALEPIEEIFFKSMGKANPGIDVAQEMSGWLDKLGAEQLKQERFKVVADKHTSEGRLQLRLRISRMQEVTIPMLISQGKLTQAEFDKVWARVGQEAPPDKPGQVSSVLVIARKPTNQI